MKLLACFLLLSACPLFAGPTNNLIGRALWPHHGEKLVCEVCEQSSAKTDELPTCRLWITDEDGKKTKVIETPDSFVAMYPISDENALFVTVWMGGTAYHLSVFTWRDRKPVCVLESGSKAFPEVVFDLTGSGDTYFLLNDAPGGMDDPANWKTTAYQWTNKKMVRLKTVPATVRFKDIH